MEKITHQMRCQQWSKIIAECLASGQNKTAWCRENGVSDKKFFYWQKILRREAYELAITPDNATQLSAPAEKKQIPFVELKMDSGPSLDTVCSGFQPDAVLQINGIIIGLSNSASSALINAIGGLLHVE